MPYRKRQYGKRKKRRYRRRRAPRQIVARQQQFSNSNKLRTMVPRSFYTKLVYTTKFSLTEITGIIFENHYRGNNIYDPDYTGVGHQPRGFDQLSDNYNKYVVLGSSCELIGVSGASGDAGVIEVSLMPVVSPSTLSNRDPEYLAEMPGSQMMVIAPGGEKQIISAYQSTANVKGVSRRTILTDDTFEGTVAGSGPNNAWYWQINAQVADENTTMDAFLYVKLVYYVKLLEPKEVVNS